MSSPFQSYMTTCISSFQSCHLTTLTTLGELYKPCFPLLFFCYKVKKSIVHFYMEITLYCLSSQYIGATQIENSYDPTDIPRKMEQTIETRDNHVYMGFLTTLIMMHG